MPDFMVFAAIVPKLSGAKVILNVHDTMPELYMSKFSVGPSHPLIRLIRLQEWISLQFADKVIAVHEPHRQLLIGRGIPADKITILMNVPDPAVFGSPRPITQSARQSMRIVYHGTIAARLGLDVALRAFAEVRKAQPSATFDIYGDGDSAGTIEELITTLGLTTSVTFSRSFFKVDDVPGLIEGATLGIIPNVRDVATELMLPVKLLEYVWMGIPVAAPRLKTIQHYFTDDMVAYYPPGDHLELAHVMKRLLSNANDRARIATNAQQFIELYNWHTMRHQLYSLIDS